jgi:hypothetical protein
MKEPSSQWISWPWMEEREGEGDEEQEGEVAGVDSSEG